MYELTVLMHRATRHAWVLSRSRAAQMRRSHTLRGPTLLQILFVSALVLFPSVAQGGRLYWGLDFPGKVYTAELDGRNIELLAVDAPAWPTGMAFDTNTQLLYWVQWIGIWGDWGPCSIRRGNGCDGNISTVTTTHHARGLAIDPVGGFLYWTDTQRVMRARLDGSNQTTLISGIRNGGGLAIDTSRGLLFYMELNVPNLHRANLDGTGDAILVPGVTGFGMDIDVPNGQVYFTVHYGMPNLVGRIDVDGSNLVGLVPGFTYDTRGLDLDLDAGHIYWTIMNQGILRADLDGTNVVTVVAADPGAGLHDFWGVTLAPPTFHCPNTPVGTDVVVVPPDSATGVTPVTVTFDNVIVEGFTGLIITDNGPPPDAGFKLCGSYYDLRTTAVYTDSVEVCIDYGPNCNNPVLKHREGNKWVEVVPAYPGPADSILCGRVASLSLFAFFEPEAPLVTLDIHPRSCPNPFNIKWLENIDQGNENEHALPKKGGVMPAAIVGSEGFDVTEIDVSTLLLEGVEPLRSSLEDVTRPATDGEECDCMAEGPDGFEDLTLKFSRQEVAAVLGPVADGDVVTLTITGSMLDGTPFEASDCVTILSKQPRPPVFSGPDQVVVHPAVPNPFNPVTRIRYALPSEGFVKLAVYDVAGRLVEQLVAQMQPAGEHIVTWDARKLRSGVYFYRLEVGSFTETRKLILLK